MVSPQGWAHQQSLAAPPQSQTLDPALSAKIVDNKMTIEYGPGWEQYFNDPEYRKFAEHVKSSNDKLAKGQPATKGAGKSKDKGSKGGAKGGSK